MATWVRAKRESASAAAAACRSSRFSDGPTSTATPGARADFEDEQYRVRAIDFDQQCYEGRKNMYLPQFYKENRMVVDFCAEVMTPETVEQYRQEERVLIRRRYETAQHRFQKLVHCLCNDELSTKVKIGSLRKELEKYHNKSFSDCKNMGQILDLHLKLILSIS